MTYQSYKIKTEIEVIAGSRTEAETFVCDILDKAFIYGLGEYEAKVMAKQYSPVDVTRVFDYDVGDEDK